MSGVFISYRRDDSGGHAGRLFDHLSSVFGADDVFMDVDDIRRGDSFADSLTERLEQSDVLLAVIGKRWLTLTDAGGVRRLDKPDDWVRAEIRAALASKTLVIPVLVGGATLPGPADLPEDLRALPERQLAEVRDGAWSDDIARLCTDIKRRRSRDTWSETLRQHWVSAAVTLLLALAAGGYAAYTYAQNSRAVVPLVSGLTLDRATQTLADAGLKVGTVSRRATNEHPPDWVLEQDPPTQTSIRKGAAVGVTVAAAKAVDLTPYVTVRDVGGEGTVAAAALATALGASLAAQGRPMFPSMRYIYEKAKRLDEIKGDGVWLESLIYVAQKFGAPPETYWPYRALNRKLPPGVTWQDLDEAALPYRARVTQLADLDGVLGALDKGMPVLAVADAAKSWWGSKVSYDTGVIKPPAANETMLGATLITIVGYDPATRRFKFANNWGSEWGDKGFGYVDATDATAIFQLHQGLWSVTVPPD